MQDGFQRPGGFDQEQGDATVVFTMADKVNNFSGVTDYEDGAEDGADTAPEIEDTGVDPEDSGVALERTQAVLLDGVEVTFQTYALKDAAGSETNYIKLRDLADALDGTAAQFNVDYDSEVILTTGAAYTGRNGQEGQKPYSGDRAYTRYTGTVAVDGAGLTLQAFTLTDDAGGGSNYFKLRDLAQALGFNVGWDSEREMIFVETDLPYDPAN